MLTGFKNKLYYAAAMAMALPALSFAEGESAATVDLSDAGTAATQIGNAVSDLITGDVLSAAKKIMIACVVLWAVWKILKWLGVGRK